jgi:hypothetical protein
MHGVWQRVVDHFGLRDVPRETPEVTSQDVVDKGRTDLTLRWNESRDVVLELKVGAPPGERQVLDYLESGKHVLVVAKLRPHYTIAPVDGCRYLGAITWGDLREVEWPEAPVPWFQLLHLIDKMGVAMKRVDLSGLTAMASSWDSWEVVEQWTEAAADEVCKLLTSPSATWVPKEKKRIGSYQRYRIYGRWIWPTPWRGWDSLLGCLGLFMGRPPQARSTVDGAPDLFLSLRLNPNSALARSLPADEKLKVAVGAWKSLPRAGVMREAPLPDSQWEFLRCRSSSLLLVQAEEPEKEFVGWARARATELVDAGIMRRLAELDGECRERGGLPEVKEGPDGTEPG